MSRHCHPCGALPQSGWSASVWYCHHHQAFFASQTCYTQDHDDSITNSSTVSINFGPFDEAEDVEKWLRQFMGDLKHLQDPDLDWTHAR